MNAKASYVSIPTPYAAIPAVIAVRSQPRSEVSSLRLLPEATDRADEEPQPAEEADDPRREQRSEPLVVEDVRLDPARVGIDDVRPVSLRRGPAGASRLERGPEVGEPAAAARVRAPVLLRDEAAGGKNDFLIAPSVPGSTNVRDDRAPRAAPATGGRSRAAAARGRRRRRPGTSRSPCARRSRRTRRRARARRASQRRCRCRRAR